MLRALVREIVLIDEDGALAEAEAVDLADANALARPARIWAGDYADAASAGIAVITAGAATHGDEPRLAVASRSARIVRSCVDKLMRAGFDGIVLVAANPVDLMAYAAFSRSGLPANRVIGTGTLLDSSRLRQALATELGVVPGSIDALVIGEHGDSEVVAWSGIRIGGAPLDRFAADHGLDRAGIADRVRTSGYRIIAGKGYTSFGVATAIVRICEAIHRGENAVLPVSTLMRGEFGLEELYLSLPCVVGASGIERVITPALSPDEIHALKMSAAILREAWATLAAAPHD